MSEPDKGFPPHLNIGLTFLDRLNEYNAISVDPTVDWDDINEKLVILKDIARAAIVDGTAAEALYWYGRNQIYGEHKVEKNIPEGMTLLERASRMGHMEAKVLLADIYCGFLKVQGNYYRPARGIVYYEAVKNGYCHYRLAECFFGGRGVARDAHKAQTHLEIAVQKYNSPQAKLLMGKQLLEGSLSEAVIGLAIRYFEEVKEEPEQYLRQQASVLLKQYAGIFLDPQAAITKQKRKVENEKKNLPKKNQQENAKKPEVFSNPRSASEEKKQDVVLEEQKLQSSKVQSLEDIEKILSVFDDYVGFDFLKLYLRDVACLNLMRQRRGMALQAQQKPMMHMVFRGPPGTGKTTAARLMGRVFFELGMLSKGHVVEVDRSKLVGEYIGQSEKITADKIAQAKGGVLFIDEAYSLSNESPRDYGRFVITSLVKAMEDMRGELIIIMAGYTTEMDKFLVSNPGLKSRVAHYFDFPEFNKEQLEQIFLDLCNQQKYVLGPFAKERLHQCLGTVKSFKLGSFGNARGVRNLFEDVIRRQARRVIQMKIQDEAELSMILPQDFPNNRPVSGGDGTIAMFTKK